MIIAGRNRGRAPATPATLGQPTALNASRDASELHRLREALLRGRASTSAPRTTLRTALRAFDTQAIVPLVLLALALSAFVPGTHFELQTASDQAALETATTLISALAAILFFDRFWRHLRLRSLVLAGGLGVIAVSNLGAGLLLAGNLVIAGHSAAWIVLGGRLVGWVLIASSAVVPDRRLRRPTRSELRWILTRASAIAAPVAVLVALSAHTTSYEILHGEPLGDPTAMLIAQILLALLTGLAAVAFRREAGRAGSPPAQLLALACAFAASSALAACATPSFYASHVGISDILGLGWLAALFACVCVEWSMDERHAPVHALARERRRMAADVHDLIMQDLSFALANARTLVDDPASAQSASTVVRAGERALAGARDVVSGLTEQHLLPIAEAVEASVRLAARNTPLTFRAGGMQDAAQPDEPTCDALVHIAREAVTNAVKHARGGSIEVSLEHEDEWRLLVSDDGEGFDAAGGGQGFGLSSMRVQAEALGGRLLVRNAPSGGTTIEAFLP
ncbi:MAG TPA: ATP-binding protein [Solirubrobacteraceae bacterium]|jgi:signal transduction histidine kinase|nr:ATP-binding protein [Solirubrobacteraceae bacterium]